MQSVNVSVLCVRRWLRLIHIQSMSSVHQPQSKRSPNQSILCCGLCFYFLCLSVWMIEWSINKLNDVLSLPLSFRSVLDLLLQSQCLNLIWKLYMYRKAFSMFKFTVLTRTTALLSSSFNLFFFYYVYFYILFPSTFTCLIICLLLI